METNEFDEIIAQAKKLGQLFTRLYTDMTGEDFELESAVRHYPLLALGAAAGLGALGGWWVARRTQNQLPPPPPEPHRALDLLDQLLPGGADRVRELLPGVVPEEAGEMAREWLDTVLEPRLREGLDSVVENVAGSKLAAFVRQQLGRLEPEDDQGHGTRQ